jgi:hypothetical protein
MTTPRDSLPKIPPFIERKSAPVNNKVDTRGMLSISTMLVSLAALTAAMLGGAKLVFDIFKVGLASSMEGLLIKIIVLGLAFFFGWVVGLVSIRAFGNLVYPIIIKIYTWGSLVTIGILYIKVIQKLYMQKHMPIQFWAYFAMLLGGMIVLFSLHLLLEDHDLRPYAIPLLIISVLQLFTIIHRYLFFASPPDSTMLFGDFMIFFIMISISALMLMHIGIFSPLRNQIHNWFTTNGNSNHNDSPHEE